MSESSEDKSFGIWWIIMAVIVLSLLYFPPVDNKEKLEKPAVPRYDERMQNMG